MAGSVIAHAVVCLKKTKRSRRFRVGVDARKALDILPAFARTGREIGGFRVRIQER